VHPVIEPNEEQLFSVSVDSFCSFLPVVGAEIVRCGVSKSLLTVFSKDSYPVFDTLDRDTFSTCVLANFADSSAFDLLESLKYNGVKAVMFHPYLQSITRQQWSAAISFARHAEKLGMFLCICTAYGSKQLYDIEVLPFAKAIVDSVRCPVILTHGGGAKVLEAMLLADKYPNIFLETSFSLPYWLGSSVELDFAFAMRKLGVDRWLYGSDSPFIPMRQALDNHFQFFQRHLFTDSDIEKIMGGNAFKFLDL
jgi:predicted TIM-barrel fold metal-dependent hydrolase